MPSKLPYDQFLQSFTLAPRVAIDLIVINQDNQICLSKRNIEPGIGLWHIPGGFLLKDETLEACITRIGKEELGLEIQAEAATFFAVRENLDADPRGHIVDLLYIYYLEEHEKVQKSDEAQELAFFSELPEMGFHHNEFLMPLQQALHPEQ